MSTDPKNIPAGVFIKGSLIAPPEVSTGTNKKGKPYCRTSFMLLCGQKVARVTTMTDEPMSQLPAPGTMVLAEIEPNWDQNGVLTFNGTVNAA